MDYRQISRRNFLAKMTAATGASFGLAGILSGCGGGGEADTATPAAEPEAAAPAAQASCTDVSGLTDAEASMRNTLGYVDSSTEDGKTCANCALYTAAAAGESCGGCTLLKGPINPNGYCVSWAMAAS